MRETIVGPVAPAVPVQATVHERELTVAADAWRRPYGVLGTFLPEFAAVRVGLKTATQITLGDREVAERERPRLERLCREAGLRCTFFTRCGLEKVIIAHAALAPPPDEGDDNCDNRFSYPECCVADYHDHGIGYDFMARLHQLLEPGGCYDFRVNPFTVATPYHLISHYPCSLRCPATLAAADRLLVALRARIPVLAAGIERFCRRPALFTDVCGIGVLFAGTLASGRVAYRDLEHVAVPAELLPKATRNGLADLAVFDAVLAALAAGDEAELAEDHLVVLREGREVRRVARPPHLCWRLVDFA